MSKTMLKENPCQFVQELRKQSERHIMSSRDTRLNTNNDTKCVGGAFCLFMADVYGAPLPDDHHVGPDRYSLRFPRVSVLAHFLGIANPSLTLSVAENMAHSVVCLNDDDRFGAAWQSLIAALTYQPLAPRQLPRPASI